MTTRTTKPSLTLLTLAGTLGVACSGGSGGGRDAGLGDFGFGDEPGPVPAAAGGMYTYATGGTRHTGGTRPTGGRTSTGGAHTGGARTGGTTSTGGRTSTGGTSTGGRISTGGLSTGGRLSTGGLGTGGRLSTGGTTASTTGVVACSGQTIPQSTGTLSVTNNYVTTGTLQGFGFTWVYPANNTTTCIAPSCSSTGCTPAFGTTALCAAGVVTPDTTYNSIVGIGFNFNQPTTGGTAGSVAAPSSVTVTVTKGTGAGDSALRVQIVDSAGNNYCVEAGRWSSGVAIPITSFSTSCWDSTSLGTVLTAGTQITAIDIVIPSDATANRPFADCLTGVTFNYAGTGGSGGAPGTGGTSASGGRVATGGLPGSGGTRIATGGMPMTGGGPGIGGTRATGGSLATGGVVSTGGAAADAGSTGGTVADASVMSTGGTVADASLLATGGSASSGAVEL
jgi:hypothetical protein